MDDGSFSDGFGCGIMVSLFVVFLITGIWWAATHQLIVVAR